MTKWCEFWVDMGLEVPYVLILLSNGERLRIIDPNDGQRCIYESTDYEDAKLWLLEDEYERIGDRVAVDR